MPYTIAVIAISNPDITDIIIAELAYIGYDGFEETPKGLTAYIKTEDFDETSLNQTIDPYNKKGEAAVTAITPLEEKNWNQEWESNFEPINIDNKIFVRAPFHPITYPYDYIITIEPKMAFGTGHHETTYLMLQEMLNHNLKNKAVLDFGCGTGILAIMATMQGATQVVAIDNDEWAYQNTLENVAVNNTPPFAVRLGDHTQIHPDEQFDMILANITRNVILETLPTLSKALLPNGTLLVSGILHADRQIIIEAAAQQHLTANNEQLRGNWAMLSFTKNERS